MRILGLLLVLLLPAQAQALSCLKPSVTRTFDEVNAATESYIVVKGRLTLDTRKLPKMDAAKQGSPDLTHVPAHLRGTSLSASGFTLPFDQEIRLDVACFGPWCGSAQNGVHVLAFLKREGGGYSLDINPCGGHVFANPKPAMHKKLVRCFQDGACTE